MQFRTISVIGFNVVVAGLSGSAYADFIEDSKANLNFRNFYYNNDNRQHGAAQSKIEEWAQGMVLDFKSGYTNGTVQAGFDILAMQAFTLDSGKGRHLNNTMIPSDGDNRAVKEWSRLGATGKFKVSQTELRIGTLLPKLPILIANDGRVLPQTFTGTQIVSKDLKDLTMTAGRLESTTGRGSTDRTGLAVAGGTQESDHFDYAGVDWAASKSLTLQYYRAKLQNYYTQDFLGLVHILSINEGSSLKTDLRYFKSRGVGENEKGSAGYRVAGYSKDGDGKIDNETWAATFIYSLKAHTLTLGYQSISDDGGFWQTNQSSLPDKGAGSPSSATYTERLVSSFNRAGEQTVYGGYGYDFAAMGIPGLKASMIYLKGDEIKVQGGPNAKEWERNIYVDYVFPSGKLKGLGLRWLDGKGRSAAFGDVDQTRLVISYSVPLL